MVAEGIRLHALEVEELRHALVVALQQLLEDGVVDGLDLPDDEDTEDAA